MTGSVTEVARCYYGVASGKVGLLLSFSGYGRAIPHFSRQLEAWLANAGPYSRDYEIPLLDLFYWEQRMGNWRRFARMSDPLQ